LDKIEGNQQVYGRGRSYTDNRAVKAQIDQIFPNGYDLTPYTAFSRALED